MAAIHIFDVHHRPERARPIPRFFGERLVLDDLRETDIIARYRLDRGAIQYLVDLLSPDLMKFTNRGKPIEPITQVFFSLCAVCFNVFALHIQQLDCGFFVCLKIAQSASSTRMQYRCRCSLLTFLFAEKSTGEIYNFLTCTDFRRWNDYQGDFFIYIFYFCYRFWSKFNVCWHIKKQQLSPDMHMMYCRSHCVTELFIQFVLQGMSTT